MHSIRNTRPNVAIVVAMLALFVALGGTSYAALKVGSKQIVDNSVRGKDVRKGTLGAREIAESKLGRVPSAAKAQSADTAASAQSAQTALTAQTAQSAQSAQTAASADDAAKLGGIPAGAHLRNVSTVSSKSDLDSEATKFHDVQCPAGKVAIGGGANIEGPLTTELVLTDSIRSGTNGWSARAVEDEPFGDPWRLEVQVICANAS